MSRSYYVVLIVAVAFIAATTMIGCGVEPTMSFSQDVHGARVVGPGGGVFLRHVEYDLAPGAAQGAGRWYVLRSRLLLELAGEVEPRASADYVSVATNGASAQLLKIERFAMADAVRWSQFGLLSGEASAFMTGRSLEIAFENYLQVTGVKGGRNVLSLSLQQAATPAVSTVELAAGSAIRTVSVPPGDLRLNGSVVCVGALCALRYEVEATGFEARDVVVRARTSMPVIWQRPAVSVSPVVRDEKIGGTFLFVALGGSQLVAEVTVDSENAGNNFAYAKANVD